MSSDGRLRRHRRLRLSILGLMFIWLKLTGHIDWSWWWVLSPLMVKASLMLLVTAGVVVYFVKKKKKGWTPRP